jgi:hypothetical protein
MESVRRYIFLNFLILILCYGCRNTTSEYYSTGQLFKKNYHNNNNEYPSRVETYSKLGDIISIERFDESGEFFSNSFYHLENGDSLICYYNNFDSISYCEHYITNSDYKTQYFIDSSLIGIRRHFLNNRLIEREFFYYDELIAKDEYYYNLDSKILNVIEESEHIDFSQIIKNPEASGIAVQYGKAIHENRFAAVGFYFFDRCYSEAYQSIGKYIDIDMKDTVLNAESLVLSINTNNVLDTKWDLQIYLNAVDARPFKSESVYKTISLNNEITNSKINIGSFAKGYHFISGVGVFTTNGKKSYLTFFDDFIVR